MESQQVQELAQTLRKQGLAMSMYEATEKAKSILGIPTDKEMIRKQDKPLFSQSSQKSIFAKQNAVPEQTVPLMQAPDPVIEQTAPMPREGPSIQTNHEDFDITGQDITVNELMQQAGVNVSELQQQEKTILKSEVAHIKDELSEIKHDIGEAKEHPEVISLINEKMEQVMKEVEQASQLKEHIEHPEQFQDSKEDDDFQTDNTQALEPSDEQLEAKGKGNDETVDLGDIFSKK